MPPQAGKTILMLTSVYPRFADDAEVPWLRETVNRLRSQDVEIVMIAPSWRGLRSHQIDGCRVVRYRYAPRNWEFLTHEEGAPNKIRQRPWLKLLAIPYLISGTVATAFCCMRERVDVIQAHWPFPHGIPAALVACIFRKPLILTFHGAELALARKSALIRFCLKCLLARADLITANSNHTRSEINQIRSVTVEVLPYGAPLAEHSRPANPRPPSPVFRILFVGRHIERKGLPVLIAAVERLGEAIPWVLEIIGEGDQTVRWKALVASSSAAHRIRFLGKVSHADLLAAYRRADVFVLPSIVDSRGDTEGLGVVLVEAITYHVPVVASRVGGIPDVIRDGETGYLVEPESPEALAATLHKVWNNPELNEVLTQNALRHVHENFSWDKIIARWSALYEKHRK